MTTKTTRIMSKEDIAKQLKRHEKFLSAAAKGSYRFLPADFNNAYLYNKDFSGSNLSRAHFYGARLRNVNFTIANLTGASFEGALLDNVDFSGADLTNVCFTRARFECVNLSDANMQNAAMKCIEFGSVTTNKNTNLSMSLRCPSSGSFIGWKKAFYDDEPTMYYDDRAQYYSFCIVKILVPEDAKRSSAFGEKCRCDKAIILGAYDYETGRPLDKSAVIRSARSFDFTYHIGDTITIPDFDDNRWVECSSGFHFFIDEESAKNYWW